MAYESPLPSIQPSEKMQKLQKERKIARELQERRHPEWNDNYELYRNKVKTNRLVQRQTVNIPIMKETIKTLLSKIDDSPDVEWKEKSGDQMREIIFQEMWNDDYRRMNLEAIDIQDKKQVLLYGRSFKMLNWLDNKVATDVLDIYDIVVDPLTNPLDLETARFWVRQNIFRSLRDILADERYSQDGKDQLKMFLSTTEGMILSAKNKEEWLKKMDRLMEMGVSNDKFAFFAAGDTVVNLCEHATEIWDEGEQKFVRHIVTYADDSVELLDQTLQEALGVDFWPLVTWGEDIETQDFWYDGVADLVRTPNKLLNIWFSQYTENRSLANMGMHWYDATKQGYQPQTYEPGQGRMLPAPGNPNETVMPVAFDQMNDNLNAINFLTQVVERGTGATAIEKGVSDEGTDTTLGEVKIKLGQALERAVTMSKFYRRAWEEYCYKYERLMDANRTGKRTLYKTGPSGKIYSKDVYPKDWKSKAGYVASITSSSEQEADATKEVQKFTYILSQFPNNLPLRRIAQKRMLKIVKLTPAEYKEVEDAENKSPSVGPPIPGQETGQPGGDTAGLAQEIQSKMASLST